MSLTPRITANAATHATRRTAQHDQPDERPRDAGERVGLTDKQQMQLGSEEYAKTLRQYPARIVKSGAAYAEVQRVARRIEAVAGRDKPAFVWRVTLNRPLTSAAEPKASPAGLDYLLGAS